uniref:Methyltransferase FkbM domain-containing protein n=2 Tax=Minutocellus polymorphus TaxID=265543 RepID=A0A7S0B1T5_9STRA|mmetsp:Transcript_9390/g.15580  ORF Transcript_9390/g.15580 Transcript_9390/m.15580 type:complete len:329 (+) Transcript_9390:47-1033(+)|eukprot:CAMPEP_0197726088 /NCGR_PEP_ID=MMETSP1434-20131217/13539_1 /TAXON_ID=265543 /ORGANISM="Minutocellus polymorphus, Strain CCMP3303" /LENGTH=328 /DNA_ID=CAMNT_0043311907 /DNA_START=50 /DNA_END=1036 /DNA_ORIENTATION=+
MKKTKITVVAFSLVGFCALLLAFGNVRLFLLHHEGGRSTQQGENSFLTASRSTTQEDFFDFTKRLRTVGEMKRMVRLPCNFIHDGLYLGEGNEVLNQVYATLQQLDDDVIPVVIEAGAHDGITKSISLKCSACLFMNTLLIEASPENYEILSKSRAYDRTVHAALCNQDFAMIEENALNSGESHIGTRGVKVPCTSLDAELDKLKNEVRESEREKIQLVFLILDVEKHEVDALKGLERHAPIKAMIETIHLPQDDTDWIARWASRHGLSGKRCDVYKEIAHTDICYNFGPDRFESVHSKDLLYTARKAHPQNSYKTSEVAKAYHYYGQ